MSDATRVTFDLRAETVTIEGPSAALTKLFEAIHAVVPTMELRVIPGSPSREGSSEITPRPLATSLGLQAVRRVIESASRDGQAHTDTLAESKRLHAFTRLYQPAFTIDRITVLAGFAVTRGDGEFTSQLMDVWFMACGWDAPANMAVALNDAHSKAEILDRRNRNRWLLNAAGLRRLKQLERTVPP